jgi:hypothetical protein
MDPEISLFFEDPKRFRPSPGVYGILFLLRRDINSCLGAEEGMSKRSERRIEWPGVMAILAGVDLLAKFLAGNDVHGQVGPRFLEFVRRYFHLPASEQQIIYQLRNSLLHSFGLYSPGKKGVSYRFRLTACGGPPLVRNLGSDIYQVDVFTLHECFERAVEEYHRDLLADAVLRANFSRMFPNYGSIPIGPA